ncbi:MAG: helix-turn-helix domain-containing protein [Pirellulaceae bacterium]
MLTVREVAERTGVGQETVLAWIGQGELRASDCSRHRSRKPRWRISDDDLQRFLESRGNRQTPAKTTRRRAVGEVIQFFS